MSTTPRTDDAVYDTGLGPAYDPETDTPRADWVVPACFARQLERELAAAHQAQRDAETHLSKELVRIAKEADERVVEALKAQEEAQLDAKQKRDALLKAVEVIKTWHNMDGSDSVWTIYLENSPEMKPIHEAIGQTDAAIDEARKEKT